MVMKQTTPYHERPAKERLRELSCMNFVLSAAPKPTVVYEAFGGIGMTAELMSNLWPNALIQSTELDLDCVAQYRARGLKNATCYPQSCETLFHKTFKNRAKLGITLDFNQCTVLDMRRDGFQRDIIRRAIAMDPAWIQITDSAIGKLHLNWPSYGLRVGKWTPKGKEAARIAYWCEVWSALNAQWPCLLKKVAHHSAASYLLFVPHKGPQPPLFALAQDQWRKF